MERENWEFEEEESSSPSSYDGDLSDQEDASFDPATGESKAINRATQVKPKRKSRKSQATLNSECLKCAERKKRSGLCSNRNKTGDYDLRRKTGKKQLGE